MRRSAARPWGCLLIVAAGCAPAATPLVPAPSSEVRHSLFLIGDAGEPDPRGEPVLAALRAQLQERGERATVVFLGDNIYPRGLPPENASRRADAERRISAQIDAVRGTGARFVFLPGNHDWVYQAGGDPEAVIRQQRFVLERADSAGDWLPRDACPGPAHRDIAGVFRLIAIDTEWWLTRKGGIDDPREHCVPRSPDAVLDSLARTITSARHLPVIVVGHHPIRTGGVHGGNFPILQHVFPLRLLHPALWVPLPVVGSLYPLARSAGISSQDVSGTRYRRFRSALDSTFRAHPPLVYAAGHDHNLQIMDGTERHGARRLVVSGSGSHAHAEPVATLEQTIFASDRAGWIRIDFHATGEVTFTAVAVDADARAIPMFREIFSATR